MKVNNLIAIHYEALELTMLTRELMAYEISPPSNEHMQWKFDEYTERAERLIRAIKSGYITE